METGGSSGERNNDECFEANVHNAAVDEVNCTDGCELMATFETHFDDAMTLMDYKVMVVLLFASPADC
jgi:hypothetical protein